MRISNVNNSSYCASTNKRERSSLAAKARPGVGRHMNTTLITPPVAPLWNRLPGQADQSSSPPVITGSPEEHGLLCGGTEQCALCGRMNGVLSPISRNPGMPPHRLIRSVRARHTAGAGAYSGTSGEYLAAVCAP